MLLNPIVAMLHNEKTDRYHPILFRESPLPGPHYEGKLIRHKSVGHHTNGFDTREEALKHIETSKDMKENCPYMKKCLDKDIPWDGEGLPLAVVFFSEDGTKII